MLKPRAKKARLVPGAGSPLMLGARLVEGGCNVAVYSERAESIFVSVFNARDREVARIALDGREGNVHFGLIERLGPGMRYGLRADGPYDPDRGLHFDPEKLLVDPYALMLDRPFVRSPRLRLPRAEAVDTAPIVPKAVLMDGELGAAAPMRQGPGLIYELNVRGYTMRHPSVQGPLRGTVAGLTTPRVIEHLKYLGVDTVELMPVAAFMDDGHLPALGLTNAWGYNPITYFAPDPRLMPRGIAELRTMTDAYRARGISVVLDVVYNHTGEGDASGPVVSLMGLDALTYYRHVEMDGKQVLVNDAGTGNTLNCDHPAVQMLVIDSLRHWVQAGGVSGFRFDLAPILGRSLDGFSPDAKLLEAIRSDDVLGQCLLIAEPWDPGPGGYQLGAFGGDFYEWNDRYRDDVRGFWRGEDQALGGLAGRLSGSADIFDRPGRGPSASVNFLAVHDGFTLRDLTSYAEKHNEANGEQNRDGHEDNLSWNCGVEGATDDADILEARDRDVRALLATLFMSRGTPMIQQGDEMGRTQQGNNNAYAQDNELTWVHWAAADGALVDYVAALIAFRRAHPALLADRFYHGGRDGQARDVRWVHPDGRDMAEADWHAPGASVLGMHITSEDDELLVWINRDAEPVDVATPPADAGDGWMPGFVSSGAVADGADGRLRLPPRAVTVLVPKPA